MSCMIQAVKYVQGFVGQRCGRGFRVWSVYEDREVGLKSVS